MSSPGFTAEASLLAGAAGTRHRSADETEGDRVVAAQFGWGGGLGGGGRVVSDCPPGQRMTWVEASSRPKYCDVPAPTRDPVTGMIVWSVQHIPCGTEYVPAHWECQWAFSVFGG
jgi:hypothetical protein